MRKNRLRELIEFVGLDYKKETTKLLIFNLLIVSAVTGLYFYLQDIYVVLIGLLFWLAYNYLIYSSYTSRKRKILVNRDNEFISMINIFQTFVVNNNNVYQSFNKLADYSSEWMKGEIEEFLLKIDDDKSVRPFVEFATHFGLKIAHNIMLSIYQMVDIGENKNQINQFTVLFNQIKEQQKKNQEDSVERSLSITTFFPIIGAALITLSLSFCIITVMGDSMNVL